MKQTGMNKGVTCHKTETSFVMRFTKEVWMACNSEDSVFPDNSDKTQLKNLNTSSKGVVTGFKSEILKNDLRSEAQPAKFRYSRTTSGQTHFMKQTFLLGESGHREKCLNVFVNGSTKKIKRSRKSTGLVQDNKKSRKSRKSSCQDYDITKIQDIFANDSTIDYDSDKTVDLEFSSFEKQGFSPSNSSGSSTVTSFENDISAVEYAHCSTLVKSQNSPCHHFSSIFLEQKTAESPNRNSFTPDSQKAVNICEKHHSSNSDCIDGTSNTENACLASKNTGDISSNGVHNLSTISACLNSNHSSHLSTGVFPATLTSSSGEMLRYPGVSPAKGSDALPDISLQPSHMNFDNSSTSQFYMPTSHDNPFSSEPIDCIDFNTPPLLDAFRPPYFRQRSSNIGFYTKLLCSSDLDGFDEQNKANSDLNIPPSSSSSSSSLNIPDLLNEFTLEQNYKHCNSNDFVQDISSNSNETGCLKLFSFHQESPEICCGVISHHITNEDQQTDCENLGNYTDGDGVSSGKSLKQDNKPDVLPSQRKITKLAQDTAKKLLLPPRPTVRCLSKIRKNFKKSVKLSKLKILNVTKFCYKQKSIVKFVRKKRKSYKKLTCRTNFSKGVHLSPSDKLESNDLLSSFDSNIKKIIPNEVLVEDSDTDTIPLELEDAGFSLLPEIESQTEICQPFQNDNTISETVAMENSRTCDSSDETDTVCSDAGAGKLSEETSESQSTICLKCEEGLSPHEDASDDLEIVDLDDIDVDDVVTLDISDQDESNKMNADFDQVKSTAEEAIDTKTHILAEVFSYAAADEISSKQVVSSPVSFSVADTNIIGNGSNELDRAMVKSVLLEDTIECSNAELNLESIVIDDSNEFNDSNNNEITGDVTDAVSEAFIKKENEVVLIEADTIGIPAGDTTLCDNVNIEDNDFLRDSPSFGEAILHKSRFERPNIFENLASKIQKASDCEIEKVVCKPDHQLEDAFCDQISDDETNQALFKSSFNIEDMKKFIHGRSLQYKNNGEIILDTQPSDLCTDDLNECPAKEDFSAVHENNGTEEELINDDCIPGNESSVLDLQTITVVKDNEPLVTVSESPKPAVGVDDNYFKESGGTQIEIQFEDSSLKNEQSTNVNEVASANGISMHESTEVSNKGFAPSARKSLRTSSAKACSKLSTTFERRFSTRNSSARSKLKKFSKSASRRKQKDNNGGQKEISSVLCALSLQNNNSEFVKPVSEESSLQPSTSLSEATPKHDMENKGSEQVLAAEDITRCHALDFSFRIKIASGVHLTRFFQPYVRIVPLPFEGLTRLAMKTNLEKNSSKDDHFYEKSNRRDSSNTAANIYCRNQTDTKEAPSLFEDTLLSPDVDTKKLKMSSKSDSSKDKQELHKKKTLFLEALNSDSQQPKHNQRTSKSLGKSRKDISTNDAKPTSASKCELNQSDPTVVPAASASDKVASKKKVSIASDESCVYEDKYKTVGKDIGLENRRMSSTSKNFNKSSKKLQLKTHVETIETFLPMINRSAIMSLPKIKKLSDSQLNSSKTSGGDSKLIEQKGSDCYGVLEKVEKAMMEENGFKTPKFPFQNKVRVHSPSSQTSSLPQLCSSSFVSPSSEPVTPNSSLAHKSKWSEAPKPNHIPDWHSESLPRYFPSPSLNTSLKTKEGHQGSYENSSDSTQQTKGLDLLWMKNNRGHDPLGLEDPTFSDDEKLEASELPEFSWNDYSKCDSVVKSSSSLSAKQDKSLSRVHFVKPECGSKVDNSSNERSLLSKWGDELDDLEVIVKVHQKMLNVDLEESVYCKSGRKYVSNGMQKSFNGARKHVWNGNSSAVHKYDNQFQFTRERKYPYDNSFTPNRFHPAKKTRSCSTSDAASSSSSHFQTPSSSGSESNFIQKADCLDGDGTFCKNRFSYHEHQTNEIQEGNYGINRSNHVEEVERRPNKNVYKSQYVFKGPGYSSHNWQFSKNYNRSKFHNDHHNNNFPIARRKTSLFHDVRSFDSEKSSYEPNRFKWMPKKLSPMNRGATPLSYQQNYQAIPKDLACQSLGFSHEISRKISLVESKLARYLEMGMITRHDHRGIIEEVTDKLCMIERHKQSRSSAAVRPRDDNEEGECDESDTDDTNHVEDVDYIIKQFLSRNRSLQHHTTHH